MGSLYTQETLGIPTGKKRVGSDQGSWLARDVECCARSRACQSTPGWAWWSHVRYAGWPHLAGTTGWHDCPRTFAALPLRTSWKSGGIVPQLPFGCAPVRLQTKRGSITPELLTAHHAVHFRLCRGLSLIMPGAVVAQNRLFWVLTLPSISKLPLSKGYGPGRAVKFSNLHFFLCAIHTHDHDWNWLKHPTYQTLFSRTLIWHVQQCWQLSHFNTKSI